MTIGRGAASPIVSSTSKNGDLSACEQLVELVSRPGVTGILLHGSRAAGTSDSSSDFDLLCVVEPNQGRQIRETVSAGSAEIDVYYASAATLRRRLYTPAMNNNNFVLNALMCGKILTDSTGELRTLVFAAQEIWQAGPPALPHDELELTLQQIKSALNSTERKLSRAHDSISLKLVDIRMGEIFSKSVYMYCVQQCRWTSSLASVLDWAREDCTALYDPSRKFLVATEREDALRALESLLKLLETAQTIRKTT